MADDDKPQKYDRPAPVRPRSPGRQAKLAQALRDNLRRRKAGATTPGSDTDGGDD